MARFRNDVETSSGGQQFLKLKDKESQYVIFMGEPYEFFNVWANGKPSVVEEGSPGAKFRFRMNAVIKTAAGTYEPRIFENGSIVYNMLKALNDEYGGLDTVIVKVTRKGSTMNDTEYLLMPLRQEIPPATKAALAKLTLLNLEHEDKPQKGNGAAESYFDGDPGPTIDEEALPF